MSELGYRRDIDGLRAVAVLLVLVFHFELLPLGSAGFIGVDVFFVISGYLITSILWRQFERGGFSFAGFYAARIRRLAPALVVTLLGVFVAGCFLLVPKDLVELARQIAAAQFYVSNVYYWQNVNYFGLRADDVVLLHTWSLAVEEQFYLVFPVLLYLLHRHARRWFWPAIGLAALASFAVNLYFVGSKPMATFYLLPARAWELLAGALLAAPGRWQPKSAWTAEGLGLAGFLAIGLAIARYEDGTGMPGTFALYPVLGAMALLVAGADRRTWTFRLLSTEPMVFIGKVSYVAYLVHWPLHVYARGYWGEAYDAPERWAMFVLSIVLAWAVWRWIEAPVRERRVMASNRAMVAGYVGALVMTVAVFAATWATAGLPQRLPEEAVRLAAFADDKSPPLSACEFDGRRPWAPPPSCRMGSPDREPRWLVFGDSHAWAGHAGFDRWLRERGESAWFAFRNTCPPLRGLHLAGDITGRCHGFNDEAYRWLAATPGVDRVFLVSTWYQAEEGRLSDVATLQRDRERSLRVFDEAFSRSLADLTAMGKTVYVWGPVPGARTHLPLARSMAAWHGREVDVEITTREHREQFGFFYRALERELERGRVAVAVIPAETLCVDGRCRVEDGGRLLYHDNAHVTASTADVWAGIVVRAERASAQGAPAQVPPAAGSSR